jgi:L-alanine-DL-glutamate epimerase-like enolase superfamily enzyme
MFPESIAGPRISGLRVDVFTIPTSSPESDGTYEWDSTTMVLVRLMAGGREGIGYSYADAASARLVQKTLQPVVLGRAAFDVNAAWHAMRRAVRNLGSSGIAAMAISAVETAMCDLKAKLLNVPLCTLLGQVRHSVPVYGSGGFTTYSTEQMARQLNGWLELGIGRVKIKIGRHPEQDLDRVRFVREIIGPAVELFVDANGALDVKTALRFAQEFLRYQVRWFEEPVTADDLEGLRFIRERTPMQIAAGEYGFDPSYFRRMLEAGAVDVLQADASRCQGFTGFLAADVLCSSYHLPLSAHCAPALHVHVCSAASQIVHIEYFHDHSRIERMLFDGAPSVRAGSVSPDLSRPGIGFELKEADTRRYAA